MIIADHLSIYSVLFAAESQVALWKDATFELQNNLCTLVQVTLVFSVSVQHCVFSYTSYIFPCM